MYTFRQRNKGTQNFECENKGFSNAVILLRTRTHSQRR